MTTTKTQRKPKKYKFSILKNIFNGCKIYQGLKRTESKHYISVVIFLNYGLATIILTQPWARHQAQDCIHLYVWWTYCPFRLELAWPSFQRIISKKLWEDASCATLLAKKRNLKSLLYLQTQSITINI